MGISKKILLGNTHMKAFLFPLPPERECTLKNLDCIPLTTCQIQIMFESVVYTWEIPQVYYCDGWHCEVWLKCTLGKIGAKSGYLINCDIIFEPWKGSQS